MAKNTKPPLPKDDFKRILDGLEIVEIEVDEFSGKVNDRDGLEKGEHRRVVKLAETARYKHLGDGETLVWHSYKLTAQTDEEQPHRLFELAVTFCIRYASSEEFEEEFFKIFKRYSLRLQTAPFARAWIHDHCLRLGVPPLIMPLVRSGQ